LPLRDLPVAPSPRRLHATSPALAILIVAGVVARPALAAPPTMSECLSANEKAINLRGDHKLKEARDLAFVCAAPSCPEVVRAACEARVRQLNEAIPRIVFEVKDASGNDLSAVAVTVDGQPFADHLDGTAIAVDPGEHTFSFAVPGEAKVFKHTVIYEGDRNRHELVLIGDASAVARPPSASGPPGAQAAGAPAPSTGVQPAAGSKGLGTQKVVGLAVGGAGVAGLGIGTIFGALGMSAWSDVKTACQPGTPSRCPITAQPTASSKLSAAQTDATVSTVGLIAGGVLLATGAVVFLTARHHEVSTAPTVAVAPTVGPGQTGLFLSGAF
jgi:hypothetical protein